MDALTSCSEQVRVECWPPQWVRSRLQCASVCDIRQILPVVSPCHHARVIDLNSKESRTVSRGADPSSIDSDRSSEEIPRDTRSVLLR